MGKKKNSNRRTCRRHGLPITEVSFHRPARTIRKRSLGMRASGQTSSPARTTREPDEFGFDGS